MRGRPRPRQASPHGGYRRRAAPTSSCVTSDNPRHEDPDAIIAEVLAGVPDGSTVIVRRDRAEAIELVVGLAAPGDVVVVAGKGHETEIEIGAERLPFDDRQVVAAAVARLSGKPGAAAGDPP